MLWDTSRIVWSLVALASILSLTLLSLALVHGSSHASIASGAQTAHHQPNSGQAPGGSAVAEVVKGDNDCDGDVDAVDALGALRWLVALSVAQAIGCPALGAEYASIFGDTDCDDDLDAVDAQRILMEGAGLANTYQDRCEAIGSVLVQTSPPPGQTGTTTPSPQPSATGTSGGPGPSPTPTPTPSATAVATPTGTPTPTLTPTPTPTPTPPPGGNGFPADPDLVFFAGDGNADTAVSIVGEKFLINGVATYEGRIWNSSVVEGLLLNSRMVNGIYDDLDGSPPGGMLPWDPRTNTEDYVANMPDWRSQGLTAIGANLQGGSNRCNGLHGDGQSNSVDNNPFGANGTQGFDDWYADQDTGHARYLARMGSIIRQADDLGMAVILGFFYFGQDESLDDEAAVIAAVDAATDWILDNGWTNVLIEINNESNIGYNHSILQTSRVDELIARVQQRSSGAAGAHLPQGHLLVSTSGGGGYDPRDQWIGQSDYVLLHGNGQSASGVRSMVDAVRAESVWQADPKPIVFNEDSTNLPNFEAAVEEYSSWGFFDNNGYQCVHDGNESDRWTLGKTTESGYWPLVAEIAGVGASPTPTPVPGSVTVEAEDMALSGYEIDGAQSDWIMLSQIQGATLDRKPPSCENR